MRNILRLLTGAMLIPLSGCASEPTRGPVDGTPVTIWATIYMLVEGRPNSGGVPIRSMNGHEIGPAVTRGDWCAGALAGSMRVSGNVYNFSGVTGGSQASCSHGPSERVRWARSPHPYGTGARDNPLRPFRSIACDIGWVGGSRPWVNGGYPAFGQQLYIPAADGVVLPDGTVHDGIFTCEDTGGAVNGNHIDVFLGPFAGSLTEAIENNPFDFVAHGNHREVEAILLPVRAPVVEAPEVTRAARCNAPAFLCRLGHPS